MPGERLLRGECRREIKLRTTKCFSTKGDNEDCHKLKHACLIMKLEDGSITTSAIATLLMQRKDKQTIETMTFKGSCTILSPNNITVIVAGASLFLWSHTLAMLFNLGGQWRRFSIFV